MKPKNKKNIFTIIGIVILGCAIGLGIHQNKVNHDVNTSEIISFDGAMPAVEEFSTNMKATGSDNSLADTLKSSAGISSKIIRNYSLNYETKDMDKTLELLNANIRAVGGEIIDTNIYTSGSENKHRMANMTVRIPSANCEKFLSQKDEIGTIINFNSSSDDVTTEYVDVQARLETLKSQQKRLQELSESANSVEELLIIEDKLYQVEANIQSYTSQMKYLNTVTDNATFNINIEEVVEYSDNVSFGQRISDAFTNGFDNFKDFIKDVLVALAASVPFILSGLGIIVVIILVLKLKNKRKSKTRKKVAEHPEHLNKEQIDNLVNNKDNNE